MKLQSCIAKDTEEGDCLRACIASLLGLNASKVPNFVEEYDDGFLEAAKAWLSKLGLTIFMCTYRDDSLDEILWFLGERNQGVPLILCGESGWQEDTNHAVIVKDGEIIHDPSDSGLVGPAIFKGQEQRHWLVYVICPSTEFKVEF